MKYCSTRGGVKGWTFEQALFSGFLKDGGIILPETIPKIDVQTLKTWSKLSYLDLMKKIVSLYVSEEIPATVLNGIHVFVFKIFFSHENLKFVDSLLIHYMIFVSDEF